MENSTNLISELRQQIKVRTAELKIEPRHTDKAHFYYVPEVDKVFSSVTAEHRHLKDPSLRNFEKNEALRYVRTNWEAFSPENIEDHLKQAFAAPILNRDQSGSIGDFIHLYRHIYFRSWIETGSRPEGRIEDIARKNQSEIPNGFFPSVLSGCAGLDKFLDDTGYQPVGCEIPVYDVKTEIAGSLDDVGKIKNETVLLDVKSSNQLKDIYTLQVMDYKKMFYHLYKIRIDKILIVKTSKLDRTYQLEWFKSEQQEAGLKANYHLHKFNRYWEKIQELRKPITTKI